MPDNVVAVARNERETIRVAVSKRVDDVGFVRLAKSLRVDTPHAGIVLRSLFANIDHES